MKVAFPRFAAALIAAAVLVPLGAARAGAQVLPTTRDDSDVRISQYRSDMLREATVTLNAWRDAWAADDVNALVRLYDRRAMVQLPGDSINRQGIAAVQTALRATLPAAGRMELGLMDADVSGDLMYILQNYMLAPADGDSTAEPVTGTTTLVLRQDGGRWKIRAQVFTPTPPHAPAVARAPAADTAAAAAKND